MQGRRLIFQELLALLVLYVITVTINHIKKNNVFSGISDPGKTPDMSTNPASNSIPCDYGYYKSASGAEACDQCGVGLNTTSTGTIFEYDCVLGNYISIQTRIFPGVFTLCLVVCPTQQLYNTLST